jgi:hypothetical protein
MVSPSPRKFREHEAALDRFVSAYERYLHGGPSGGGALREAVIDSIPAADNAMDVANAVFYIEDPPMLGPTRRRYYGLANTAFLHEQPGFRPTGLDPAIFERVIDAVRIARSRLEERAREEERRRRNPFYWIDRALRLALAIPAYLVSLIVGTSPVRVDRSAWGVPLRILGVVADGLAIYFAGRAFHLW